MTIAPSTATAAADGLLASLDPEQRAAAMLPDGPAQVIAPAGSGKTTTLIARLGVLLERGMPPERIGVVTFNRDAAAELAARIASRLAPHVPGAVAIEVRTLHAMARQVLLDAGRPVRLLADRLPVLRAARRRALAAFPVVAGVDDRELGREHDDKGLRSVRYGEAARRARTRSRDGARSQRTGQTVGCRPGR